jgi:hypothetical protein
MVIVRLEVSLSASSIAGTTADGGTVSISGRGSDGETVLGESGVRTEVDAAHVPEDGVTGLGVLELEDIGLVRLSGQLDGDATAVVVGLPGFLVVATARRKGMHVTDSIRNRPRVDGVAQVVDEADAATAGAIAFDGSGESRGKAGKSSKSKSLGEHHFEWSKSLLEKEKENCDVGLFF